MFFAPITAESNQMRRILELYATAEPVEPMEVDSQLLKDVAPFKVCERIRPAAYLGAGKLSCHSVM